MHCTSHYLDLHLHLALCIYFKCTNCRCSIDVDVDVDVDTKENTDLSLYTAECHFLLKMNLNCLYPGFHKERIPISGESPPL